VSQASVRQRIEYTAVLGIRSVVGIMPDVVARGVGTAIGLAFHGLDGAHRRLAVAQLQAAFPTRSRRECRVIARQTFIHFGRMLTTVLRASRLAPEEILARVDVEGVDRVRKALEGGRGAIIFTGHFGYWELHGLVHALLLPPMSLMARPLDNPYLHAMLEAMRCRTGNQVIYRQGALRRVLRTLQANECIAMLIDQHIQGSDAVPVDFFNRPAATTAALATLALRTGAPLIPAFALPLPGGRFRLVYEHPVEPPLPTSSDPVRELTQRASDVLEMYVRRHPHLWLWMHRRWRDLPEAVDREPDLFPAGVREESEQAE
jgi:KDO2-lipid IV(A) lauroyltransferase